MPANQKYFIWSHFKKLNNNEAECNICSTKIATKNGHPSNLVRHYKNKHSHTDVSKEENSLSSDTTGSDNYNNVCVVESQLSFTSEQRTSSSMVSKNYLHCLFTCGICLQVFTGTTQLKIECEDCKKLFHPGCCKISKADLEMFAADGLDWRCEPCAIEHRKNRRLEIESSTSDDDCIKKLLLELRQLKEECKNSMKELSASYETIKNKLDENIELIMKQTEYSQFDKTSEQIDKLLEERAALKNKNIELEQRLGQYVGLECEVIECKQVY